MNNTPSANQLQKTTELYNGIIDSVIKNIREPFYDEGLDDQVIQELKQLWINKLSDSGVLSLEPSRPVRPQQQASSSTVRQQKQPEQNYPGHPSQRPRLDFVENQSNRSLAFAARMQQQLQNQQKNNNNINSQQYQNPQNLQQTQLLQQSSTQNSNTNNNSSSQQQTYYHVDGQFNLSDSESEDDKKSSSSSSSSESEDEADDKKSTSSESAKSSTGDVEEIALNSNDDISEDDSVSFENTTNIIHCQYEHVKRKQAAKWTIKLTNGIMNLEGKDYSFSKCAGEADW